MKMYRAGVLLLAAGLALAACGASDTKTSAGGHAASADDGYYGTDTPSTTATSDASIKTARSPLGTILVDNHGRTLYGFTNDADGRPTCNGACAKAWPPITTKGGATVGAAGPAASLVATVRRSDGTSQVKVGKWPVYLFAGDAAPGDVNGEGSGGTWFALAVDGTLVKQAPAPAPTAPTTAAPTPTTTSAPAPTPTPQPAASKPSAPTPTTTSVPAPTPQPPAPTPQPPASKPVVGTRSTSVGTVLVDGASRTLYGFTADVNGTSSCTGACAQAWPPLLVASNAVPDGLDANVFHVITRPDGRFQLAAGRWPLYRYTGDGGPGDVYGQGSGGTWFAAAPDGSLIRT